MRVAVLASALAACTPEPPPSALPVHPAPALAPAPGPRASAAATAPTSRPTPRPTAPAEPPPPPPIPDDGVARSTAPEPFDHLILAATFPVREQLSNLRYEGNNSLLSRGATSGEEVAERWRRLVVGTAGVFVLRDSLFSQQDYAAGWEPVALMLPPAWITTAVVETAAGRDLVAVRAPAVDDDGAWAASPSVPTTFGSFPPSDALHRRAIRPLRAGDPSTQRATRASRASIRALAALADELLDAAPQGPEAVARAGAEAIAQSDRAYFGWALRHHRVIPLLVEHPTDHERATEGKGFTVVGRSFPAELVRMTTHTVIRRRLADGDVALERYDITQRVDRDRAIGLLEAVVPAEEPDGARVWLWVTGRPDVTGHMPASATPHLAPFLRELGDAAIAHDRVRVVSMPKWELPPGEAPGPALRREARWFRHRHLPLPVAITAREARRLVQ